jgi:hypothetical protein
VRYAVIHEGDGHLLSDQVPLSRDGASAPALDVDLHGDGPSAVGLLVTL